MAAFAGFAPGWFGGRGVWIIWLIVIVVLAFAFIPFFGFGFWW